VNLSFEKSIVSSVTVQFRPMTIEINFLSLVAIKHIDRLQLMCCKKSEQAKSFNLPEYLSPSGLADSIEFSI